MSRSPLAWRKAAVHWRGPVLENHPILAWLVRRAACLHSVCHMGHDGRAPTALGESSGAAAAEFGEWVVVMIKGPNRRGSGHSECSLGPACAHKGRA